MTRLPAAFAQKPARRTLGYHRHVPDFERATTVLHTGNKIFGY